jgi:hypothetical protein
MAIHASSYLTDHLRDQELHSLSFKFGLGPVARIHVKVRVEVVLGSDWGVPPHLSLVSHLSRARLADLHRPDASVPEALAFGGGASPVLSHSRSHSLCSFELSSPYIACLSFTYTQCVSMRISQRTHRPLRLPPAISAADTYSDVENFRKYYSSLLICHMMFHACCNGTELLSCCCEAATRASRGSQSYDVINRK